MKNLFQAIGMIACAALILTLVLMGTTGAFGQSITSNGDGTYAIEIPAFDTNSKDKDLSAITLMTSACIQAKQNSGFSFDGSTVAVSYASDTKMYTVKCGGTFMLETTTISAVRNQVKAWLYRQITNKELN